MKIQPIQISVRQLFNGFKDSGDYGVVGYDGRLNIRPAYQREFVYNDEKRDKVIGTVRKGYPLNVMYWALNPDPSNPSDESLASYEVLDGQQRTLSICKYVSGDFSIDEQYFHGLPQDKRDDILNYELTVYICEGLPSEKLDWFRTINIAGEKLTDQELMNAVYTGPWLTSAKTYFSKTNCPAYLLGSNYVSGSPIHQELLKVALNWISKDSPASYMSVHQHDKTAVELWNHFSNIINWVKANFPIVRREMKSVNWGALFSAHNGKKLDPDALEERISDLMMDEDVTKKYGIYQFVLDGNERHLNIRAFSEKVKRETYTKQNGVCADGACPAKLRIFNIDEMEADHIDPWHSGGKSVISNCRMLCKSCNRRKGGI